MPLDDAIREHLLSFADDEHLMGQQHTEWIGIAPFLEEDLAFASIGQDELGHAVILYEFILELDGVEVGDASIDELAYRRPHDEYRSCELVEYATTDWAEALVRHWCYDTVEAMRWQELADSTVPALADIAARAEREEIFHVRHANSLLDALSSEEARARIASAAKTIVPMAMGLMDPMPNDFIDRLGERFPAFEINSVEASEHDRTTRSADFAPLMARMREVLDFDPAAVW